MKMPDITPAQILAGLTWIASQAIAFGVIQHAPSQQMLSGVATALAIGWQFADSHLRGKRAVAHAILNAPVADTKVPLVTPPVTTQM